MTNSKTCRACLQLKDLTEFSAKTSAKDGHNYICRECAKAHYSSWRNRDLEKARAAEREWKRSNPEKVKQVRKAHRERNRDVINAALRERYHSNLEESRLRSRTYKRARRARKLNGVYEPYSEQQVLAQYGNVCHICSLPIDLSAPRRVGVPGWENGLHIDHVVSLKNGGSDSLDNVKPAHGVCNLEKH